MNIIFFSHRNHKYIHFDFVAISNGEISIPNSKIAYRAHYMTSMPFQTNAVFLCMMGCSRWKMETGRGQVNSHYRDMSVRHPHVCSSDIAWEIGSLLLHMQYRTWGHDKTKNKKTKKQNHFLAWLAVSSLLKREKKINIIVCDKILPFNPPATYHSAVCPECVTADA